jgi:hypothetical protein
VLLIRKVAPADEIAHPSAGTFQAEALGHRSEHHVLSSRIASLQSRFGAAAVRKQ